MINNAFYDDLNDAWYEEDCHPIALLRAENAVRNPWILKTLKDYGKKSCRILDIGCGGGLLSNELARAGHVVTGIDLSQSSLDQAKKRDVSKSVEYIYCNAEKIPFEDETFDVVCAMDFLEHVESPETIIQEASRLLKPGGLFFFHTFNRNFLSYLLVIKCVEWLVPNVPRNMHVYNLFIRPDELKSMCLKSGLHMRSIQGLMPDMKSAGFWKSFVKRKVSSDFRFAFTPSIKVGFVGFACKT
ncbi:MAG: 3-demethylubiquinone-9 3-O-methyltransferase [Verrucomicrobia bacterium]|nr:3-demethylubiquinone-9 3-O-methyltransferase [Verrucomicrobiota bacterium]